MSTSDIHFLQKIDFLLLNNLDDGNFSIDLICKELGISRSHLHRKIKDHTGLSTSLYFRKVRLGRAKELLESTQMNISEVAYATGITSPQNFSKYFVTEFGLSPSAYRKSLSEPQGNELEILDNDISSSNSIDSMKIFNYRWAMVILGVVVSLIFSISSYYRKPVLSPEIPVMADFKTSIAVLPFKNLTQQEPNYFADGMLEDILTHLSMIEEIKVISRTSSAKYVGTDKTIGEIADELQVEYVMEGSVQELNGEIKVHAQLIRTADDAHLWAKQYRKKIEDVFKIQNELALDIAFSLNQNLSADIQDRFHERPTENMQAYNDLIIGRELIKTRKRNDLEEGLKRFNSAIALDDRYAQAYALKATAISLIGDMSYVNGASYVKDVEENALIALKYDPKNAHAYAVLANIYARQYKWKASQVSYQIALKEQPNNALFNYWYSLLLRSQDLIEEAMVYNQRAKLLDPLHPVIYAGYIATCTYGGFYEEAEKSLEKDRDIFGKDFLYYWASGIHEKTKGNYQSAIALYEKAYEISPEAKSIFSSIMYCNGKLGRKQLVLDYIKNLDQNDAIDYHRIAVAYAGLDMYEESVANFVKAAKANFIGTDFLSDPTYEPYLNDPRIVKVLKEKGFLSAN